MTPEEAQKKLNADISSAIAAGMSYGKWIAMQPIVETPKKPSVIGIPYFTCEYCGCQFTAENPRKYCTKKCRDLGVSKTLKGSHYK